ncbi:MAG TPA: hypothetical protein VK171_12065 [Fimbriimonas sp.]|nr:hypothetical protein [Fimbriimonas sp.]
MRQTIDLNLIFREDGKSLDELYQTVPQGNPLSGNYEGFLIFFPGGLMSPLLRAFGHLVWQGKVFADDGQSLVNLVTLFRIKRVPAKVYTAESWLDGKSATIFDYSKSSFIARFVRDEVREIAPGLYLGQAYFGKRRVFRFALQRD